MVQKLFIGITQTEGSGGVGLLQFLKDRKSFSPSLNSSKLKHFGADDKNNDDEDDEDNDDDEDEDEDNDDDILARFTPIIPKVFHIFIY